MQCVLRLEGFLAFQVYIVFMGSLQQVLADRHKHGGLGLVLLVVVGNSNPAKPAVTAPLLFVCTQQVKALALFDNAATCSVRASSLFCGVVSGPAVGRLPA
jgi:hypothetical protein